MKHYLQFRSAILQSIAEAAGGSDAVLWHVVSGGAEVRQLGELEPIVRRSIPLAAAREIIAGLQSRSFSHWIHDGERGGHDYYYLSGSAHVGSEGLGVYGSPRDIWQPSFGDDLDIEPVYAPSRPLVIVVDKLLGDQYDEFTGEFDVNYGGHGLTLVTYGKENG